MHLGRLIVSGLVIGALTNIGYTAVMAWLLLWPWKAALAGLGRPPFWIYEVTLLSGFGFLAGFGAAWLYAAIIPRFGSGPRTALYVGTAIWGLCHVSAFGFAAALGMPLELMAMTAGIGLVISIVATQAGALLYRERPA